MRLQLSVLFAVWVFAAPVFAQPATPEQVRALAEDVRIELLGAPGSWSARDVAALRAGAAAMPATLLSRLDTPIAMRRVHHACLFGTGRDTQRCPTYDRDGAFLIYDMPPVQGEGPVVERFALLNAAEREELQRRRAAVHAVMLANDREARWSQRRDWRRINGWRASAQPLNRDLWGYSRYLGYRSARLDLVTFAEEWFVRPEDVIHPLRRDRIAADRSIECDAFSKHRFLSALLVELAPTWSPNRSRTVPHCPAFEAWARQHDLRAVELVVAAPSTARPEDLYGAPMLRLRYGDPALDRVLQFRAVRGDVDPLTSLSRGLLGGLIAVLEQRTPAAVAEQYHRREQRDLHRYTLHLTAPETRRLLERIWEVQRQVRLPFQLFVNNGASFLLDLLEPALSQELPGSGLLVTPTDVVRALTRAGVVRAGAVIDPSPRTRARDATATQREAAEQLAATLAVARHEEQQLRELLEQTQSRDSMMRRIAYADLREVLNGQLERRRNDRIIEAVMHYLQLCIRVEQHRADVARTQADATLRRPVAADTLLERHRLLGTTDRPAPPPPHDAALTTPQLLALHETDEAEATLNAAINTRDALVERFAPRYTAATEVGATQPHIPTAARSLIALGGAVAPDPTTAGALYGRFAYIDEPLGLPQHGGFAPHAELRVLDFAAHLPLVEQPWRAVDLDITLLRFMTVVRALGWGGDIFAGHDGRRGLDLELGVAGGVLLPLLRSDHNASHLVLGVYADARAHLGRHGRQLIAGGEASLRGRLQLGSHALLAEGATRHGLAIEALRHSWTHRGRIATEHPLADFGGRSLHLAAWGDAEWTSDEYLVDATRVDARVGLALQLRL